MPFSHEYHKVHQEGTSGSMNELYVDYTHFDYTYKRLVSPFRWKTSILAFQYGRKWHQPPKSMAHSELSAVGQITRTDQRLSPTSHLKNGTVTSPTRNRNHNGDLPRSQS